MSKKKPRNTKSKIIAAAWKLFYEQGYEETTLEEIILESGTSKGSFYHYFDGKDALLESLSFLFDEKYEELEPQLTRFETYFEQLIFLNQELFTMIENTIAIDLLSRLLSTQLVTSGEKHLLDHNRTYYKLLRRIIAQASALPGRKAVNSAWILRSMTSSNCTQSPSVPCSTTGASAAGNIPFAATATV